MQFVLHAYTRGRPYRAEGFVGSLNQLGVRKDVARLRAIQMGHVWLPKLHISSAKEKLLRVGNMLVKGRPCLVVYHKKRELKVKSTVWHSTNLQTLFEEPSNHTRTSS